MGRPLPARPLPETPARSTATLTNPFDTPVTSQHPSTVTLPSDSLVSQQLYHHQHGAAGGYRPVVDRGSVSPTPSSTDDISSVRSAPRNSAPHLALPEKPGRSKLKKEKKGPIEINEKQVPLNSSDDTLPVTKEKVGIFRRIGRRFRRTYNSSLVDTVLPSAPRDDEKYLYCKLNRFFLLTFDLLAAVCVGGSTWLMVKTGPAFYWYGFYAVILFFFIYPSYVILCFKKGFDLKGHKRTIEEMPITDDNAPTIDIYLPVCKEECDVLENTWTYIQQLEYPFGKVQVYVLDDGAEERVAERARRFGFHYIVRSDRPHLKKAGNIRWAFERTAGDYFVIFDADFCPRSDFLLETVPVCMADPSVAIVQTPQYFRSLKEQSWVEQAAGPHQEYFYRLVQTMRSSWGATVCCGSNAVYRRESLALVGGAAEVESSEDMYTGVQMVDRGYKVLYVPIILACGVCPSTIRSYFAQQARWCSGSVTLLTNREFWRTKLTFSQKLCFALGFFYYLTSALGIFLNTIPGPLLLWANPKLLIYYNMFFGVPGIIHALVITPLWARTRYPPLKVQYANVIVAYACISTFIGCMFKKGEGSWVSSGANKNSKNARYRNMRILAWIVTILHYGNLITAVTWRLLHGLVWYHVLPMLVLEAFWLLVAHRFLLGS
ncbi:nucleotide-diphospho-sugar transferase [Immersiella caudata]|uniref:Nucleotide-diphospho-sugar transferase n=1 Tax=Immersiella caudata TaxID=314043 RepID=A0AA39TH68_9PEZI|nr:nucleotide-diphospho-sugar transferase [Immersiella caudata]